MVKVKVPKKKLFETEFDELPITTQTVIANTNFGLNIDMFYEKFTPLSIVPNVDISTFDYLRNGSIVFMKIDEKEKGIEPIKGASRSKKRTTKKETKKSYKRGIKNFLNSLTIVMYIKIRGYPKKFMNFKISKNGKFQITGCKSIEHAKACVKNIWKIANDKTIFDCVVLKEHTPENPPMAVFKKVMINTDFDIGYEINREALDTYISEHTDFISNFERSGGYTGVNIKCFCKEPENYTYPILKWDINDPLKKPETTIGTISDWYKMMTDEEIVKEKRKKPKVTILAFVSGNAIITGPYMAALSEVYGKLRLIFKENRNLLEQKFDD